MDKEAEMIRMLWELMKLDCYRRNGLLQCDDTGKPCTFKNCPHAKALVK